MRCDRTCAAILGIALAMLHSGCQPTCPSADRAPVPAGRTASFAVLARDAARAEITLLDETGAPITFTIDGSATETDVWLDESDDWEAMLVPTGIGLEPQLAWTPLPASLGGPFVTVLVPEGPRAIARFPVDGSAPIETATERDLLGAETAATGGAVRDVIVGNEDGVGLVLWALRSPGALAPEVEGGTGAPFGEDVLVIDPALDPELGGAIIGTIPLGGAGQDGAPAGPERMVAAFDRLYVGLDRRRAATTGGGMDAVAPGAIAIVDPGGRRLVGTFELDAPALTRCGQITRAADDSGDPNAVFLLVACRGSGADLFEQQQTAGVVRLRVERDPDALDREPVITVDSFWLAASSEYAILPSRGLVALPGNAFAAIADGDSGVAEAPERMEGMEPVEPAEPGEPRDDVLFVVDLDDEPQQVRRVARGAVLPAELSGLGTGAFLPDAGGGGLLVWAAGRQGILRRRVLTAAGDDGGADVVLCPSAHEACAGIADAPPEGPTTLCGRLVVRQVRLLSQP